MPTLSITDTGARPRPDADNTDAIQEALDRCALAGGGLVEVPPGVFRTGPIDIASGVELCLAGGAVLAFDDDPIRYPMALTRWEGVECYAYRPLIGITGAVDVAIRGDGVIDGCGTRWWSTHAAIRAGELDPRSVPGVVGIQQANANLPNDSGGGGRESGFLRPVLLGISDSSRVTLEGFTARNPPFWNTHVLYSSHVAVRRVRFESPADAPNTDGVDVDSSEHVNIDSSVLDVGDDCIVLKSGSGVDGRRVARPTRDVVVTHCRMAHGHGGVVIGSETAGGISDVRIDDCEFVDTDRGIRIKSRRGRGGAIDRIAASNLRMERVGCPLVVNLYYRIGVAEHDAARAASLEPLPVDETTPSVGSVHVSRLTARSVRYAAAVLYGLPESPLHDITLDECTFELDPHGEPGEPAMDFSGSRFARSGIVTRFAGDPSLRDVRVLGADRDRIDLT